MATDPIVDFAQRRFGTDAGLPADATTRAPLPAWLGGVIDAVRQWSSLKPSSSTTETGCITYGLRQIFGPAREARRPRPLSLNRSAATYHV